MNFRNLLLIPTVLAFGCAGTISVLGMPTVASDVVYDLGPEVTNPDEVLMAMREGYPPLLRDAGIRGEVILLVLLDETGQIQQTFLEKRSGHQALDEMALELAKIIKWNPAKNGEEAVPVLVRIPVNLVPPPPQRATKRVRYLN